VTEPKLSVVLATDEYATIRAVVDRLRSQTIREEIELILVAPSASLIREGLMHRQEFANIQILEHDLSSLGPPRAAGIRAAHAPLILIGETHTYANPEFAEAIVAAFAGPWTTVTPSFGNANPDDGPLSWSAYLSDYGLWGDGLPAGPLERAPIHNTVYRRAALLEFGDRLEAALSRDDELWRELRSHGHTSYYEPRARLEHANVSQPGHWIRERFAIGLQVSSQRVRRWPMTKRLVYVAASVLIPVVLVRRVMPAVRRAAGRDRLPRGTVSLVVLGMVIWGIGELAGYLGFPGAVSDRLMLEYEVRKLAYTDAGADGQEAPLE